MQIPAAKKKAAAVKRFAAALVAADDPLATLAAYVELEPKAPKARVAEAFAALLPALDKALAELDAKRAPALDARLAAMSATLGRPEGVEASLDRERRVAAAAKDWKGAAAAVARRRAHRERTRAWTAWECDAEEAEVLAASGDRERAKALRERYVRAAEENGAWDAYLRGLAAAGQAAPEGEALDRAREKLTANALAAAEAAEERGEHDRAADLYGWCPGPSAPVAIAASRFFARRGRRMDAESVLRSAHGQVPRGSKDAEALEAALLELAVPSAPKEQAKPAKTTREKITSALKKPKDPAKVLKELVEKLNRAIVGEEWDAVGALLAEDVDLAVRGATRLKATGRDEALAALAKVPFGGALVASPARVAKKTVDTERVTLALEAKPWVDRGELTVEVLVGRVTKIILEVREE